MRSRMFLVFCLTVVGILGAAAPGQAQCEADGDFQFVCGPVSPEDLALIPNTPWVIVASWEADGYLSAADSRTHNSIRLFPTASSPSRHDTATYGSCHGMSTERFQAHGISLRQGRDGVHTLYVVRHGARESVEVFEVNARGSSPNVTWTGCAIAPDGPV